MDRKQIPFKIISHSSQYSPNIGAAHLLEQSNPSKPPSTSHAGWISTRNPSFPQEINIHLDPENTAPRNGSSTDQERNIVKLKRIEILSHHYFIAKRIEFFISRNGDENSFRRLGYVKMSDNIDTQFRSRELKSIKLENLANLPIGRVLRIKVYDPHQNDHNKESQVGIVSIGLYGESLKPNAFIQQEVINNHLNEQNFQRQESLLQQRAKQQNANSNPNYLTTKESALIQNDPEIGPLISKLDTIKSEAILSENFDKCIKIKAIQEFVSKISSQYVKLDVEKRNAISNEDFHTAKELKNQIDEVRVMVLKNMDEAQVFKGDPDGRDVDIKSKLQMRQVYHQNQEDHRPIEQKFENNNLDYPAPGLSNSGPIAHSPREEINNQRSQNNYYNSGDSRVVQSQVIAEEALRVRGLLNKVLVKK